MSRRLALLADGNLEGAWIRASGDESAVRIKGLGDASVVLRVESRDSDAISIRCSEGNTDLLPFNPTSWIRYQAVKSESSSTENTSVEVLLG